MGCFAEVSVLQGHAGLTQFLGVGDSLVSQWVEFGGDQERRRQRREIVRVQGHGALCRGIICGAVAQVGVPEPGHEIACKALSGSPLCIGW